MSERLGIGLPLLALVLPSGSWLRAPTLPILVETLALVAGWGVAAAALRELLRARRRLEAVARAEHELRGPAAVLLLACERMRREPSGRRHALALEVELERMGRGLTALTTARTGRQLPPGGRTGESRDPRTVVPGARAGDGRALSTVAPGARAGGSRDLRTFVDGALAGWEPSLRAAGRPTRFRWDAGRVGLPSQRAALASALGNLVANAAEHGRGPVEVSGSRVPGAVRVEVRNGAARRSRQSAGKGSEGRLGRARDRAGRGLGRPSPDDRAPGPVPAGERGRGLAIADAAAREAGATLAIERGDADFIAALELPIDVADTFERWFGGRPRDRPTRRS